MTRDCFIFAKTEKQSKIRNAIISSRREINHRGQKKTKRNNVNRSNHREKAFGVLMIVLLQSLPELLNKSGRLKVKTSTLPGCEESVTSRIWKKPDGSGVTLLNGHFINF